MEKNLLGTYTYKGKEYEYHYCEKLTLAEIAGIAECVADEVCYRDGVFNFRPSYSDYFIKQFILLKSTDILTIIPFETENEVEEAVCDMFFHVGNDGYLEELYFKIMGFVAELIEHKKQEYYHRDQLSEAIGSLVDVITDKFKDVNLKDVKKELLKSIAQVIHETNTKNKEENKKISKKKTDNKKVVPVNVLADK